MFSVTSLGFLPFMALFVCLWYRVPSLPLEAGSGSQRSVLPFH